MAEEIKQENQLQEIKQDSNAIAIKGVQEAFKVASALSKATIVPVSYQNNPANCYIALDMAERIGASPMMVMQNLYMVGGRPAWSSAFIIATINMSGRFATPLQYKIDGSGDDYGCIAWARSKDGTICESSRITIGIAKAEGWYNKNGSKWKTMPEVMLRYRAASFFGRQYCPELLMGMQSREEIIELSEDEYTFESTNENTIQKNANTGEIISAPEPAKKVEKVNTQEKENKTIVEPISSQKQDVVAEYVSAQKEETPKQQEGLFDPYAN